MAEKRKKDNFSVPKFLATSAILAAAGKLGGTASNKLIWSSVYNKPKNYKAYKALKKLTKRNKSLGINKRDRRELNRLTLNRTNKLFALPGALTATTGTAALLYNWNKKRNREDLNEYI